MANAVLSSSSRPFRILTARSANVRARSPSHSALVFSPARLSIFRMLAAEIPIPHQAPSIAADSPTESNRAANSAAASLAAGVARTSPGTAPSFKSARDDTSAPGVYGYENGTRPTTVVMLAGRWQTVPAALHDSATDDAIAPICSPASAR